MKQYLVILSLFFLSCSEEEVDITGNWNLSFISIESCITINDNLFVNLLKGDCTLINTVRVCYDANINITDDQLILSITTEAQGASRTDVRTFDYVRDGVDMILCEGSSDCWEGLWALEGDTFTFAGIGVQDGCSILLEVVR